MSTQDGALEESIFALPTPVRNVWAALMADAFPNADISYWGEWAERFRSKRAWSKADSGVRKLMRIHAITFNVDPETL